MFIYLISEENCSSRVFISICNLAVALFALQQMVISMFPRPVLPYCNMEACRGRPLILEQASMHTI